MKVSVDIMLSMFPEDPEVCYIISSGIFIHVQLADGSSGHGRVVGFLELQDGDYFLFLRNVTMEHYRLSQIEQIHYGCDLCKYQNPDADNMCLVCDYMERMV